MLGNVEDCMTKLVRLIANISTEEENTTSSLLKLKIELEIFISKTLDAISRRTIEQNEEFVMNAISCLTNILFYDTPSTPVLTDETRRKIF
jgi:hypothetical protein